MAQTNAPFLYISIMILAVKCLLLSWFWCKFEPIGYFFDGMRSRYLLIQLIIDNIQCPKCVGFWFTLTVTQNIYLAITVSICNLLLSKLTKTT